jgi:hypothetical protein
VTTTATTPAGTYPLVIKASNLHYTTTLGASLTVVAVPSFTMTAGPSSQTVVPGSSTSYSVTTTALNGFNGSVSLAVSGLPSGATGTFSPSAIAGAGSSTLTIATTTAATTGTKTLTITATSGAITRTATVALVINAPAAAVTYEAEATGNTRAGTVATGTCSGCSGGVRIRFIGGAANYLTINNISSTTATTHTLTIYPVVSGTRTLSISVNGGTAKSFTATGTSWTGPSAPITTTVTLKAGSNNIRFFNSTTNAPDLDRITVK